MRRLARSLMMAEWLTEGLVGSDDEHTSAAASEIYDQIDQTKAILMKWPEFAAIQADEDRAALERGRIWSAQRAEKIALLRLAGDDAPEDQIP